MKINLITLSYDEKFEKRFRESYFNSSIGLLRKSFILGMLYYAVFFILDMIVVPEFRTSLFKIRFIYVIPIILIIYFLSFTKSFKHWWQLAAGIATVVSGLGIIAMTRLPSDLVRIYYHPGIMLVLIYCYMLIRLRFVWASLAGWIIVSCYALINLTEPLIESDVFTINLFFIISANILGMFGGYALEYFIRKDFYNGFLLAKEKGKVADANDKLEKKVKEKTFKLEKLTQNLNEKVIEQTKELEEKVVHLQRFHDATIERELRMEKLRDELEKLKEKYGE